MTEITCYNIFPESEKGNIDVLESDFVDKIRDTTFNTPLHFIARHKIETLDHFSVDKVMDDFGTTPMHYMTCNFGTECLKHPSVDKVRNHAGVTPLHFVAWHSHEEALDHPSLCRVFDHNNDTPLHLFLRSHEPNYDLIKKKFDWFDFKKHEKYTKKGNLTTRAKLKVLDILVAMPNSTKFIREKK